MAQLDDVFAEVGFDRLDPRRFERRIETDLLRDHRLALGRALCAEPFAEVDDDLPRRLGVLGEMDVAAAFRDLALVGFEIEVEMGERMILDRAGAVAQAIELGQPFHGGRATSGKITRKDHRALEPRVGQRLMDVLLEARRGHEGGHRPGSFCGSPIAGPSAIPARTSATCRAFTGEPSR